jgi:4'-phosphopantetheinyl transferase
MTRWQTPPLALALDRGDVHVWRLRLAQPPDAIARLGATLTGDEHARASRFYFERDRTAFTVARGALRTLLGRYTGAAPAALVLGYRDKGKPYLLSPPGDLEFNVSHSGDFALLAFTRGAPIGVDVERHRPLDDLHSLAKFSFSPSEYAALCALPATDHVTAFYACWSRKEAFIKLTGEGVSQLAEFDVSLRPGEPMRLLRFRDQRDGLPWALHELPAIPGHSAALAVEADPIRLSCWEWST